MNQNNIPAADPTPTSEDDEISLLDLLQVVADNLRLLVLGPLVAGLLALGYSFLMTPIFTATAKFLPPQQQQSGASAMLQSLGALGGLAGAATGLKNPSDQFIAMLKSRSVQDALVDRFKLMDLFEAKYRVIARNALDGSTLITSGKDGIISIEYSDKDPVFAAQVANAYIEELSLLLNRLALTEAQQRRLFFEKQLNSAKNNLIKAEFALKSSGVSSSTLKTTPNAIAELANLKARITGQEIKIGSMRGYLNDTAPDMRQAHTELAAMRVQLKLAENSDVSADSADGDYISKFREFKYQETLFELFTKQYEVARIDEAREGAVIQVVDAALPPELKAKPKKAQIAVFTTLASGFALLVFVFVRQVLRTASSSIETAEKLTKLKAAFRKAFKRT